MITVESVQRKKYNAISYLLMIKLNNENSSKPKKSLVFFSEK